MSDVRQVGGQWEEETGCVCWRVRLVPSKSWDQDRTGQEAGGVAIMLSGMKEEQFMGGMTGRDLIA